MSEECRYCGCDTSDNKCTNSKCNSYLTKLELSKQLQTAKEENEKLKRVSDVCCAITHKESVDWEMFVQTHNDKEIAEEFKRYCNEKDLRLTIQDLTQQNKQMREALNQIATISNYGEFDIMTAKLQCTTTKNIAQQALKGGE